MQIQFDAWRWASVPFFVRAGKRMQITATEVMAELRPSPQNAFDEMLKLRGNHIRFRLGPGQVAIAIGARSNRPGPAMEGEEIELYVCNAHDDETSAYEPLIGDAIKGDATLFARRDGVEECCRIVDPILRIPKPAYASEPGTWGPVEADKMIESVGGWLNPNDEQREEPL